MVFRVQDRAQEGRNLQFAAAGKNWILIHGQDEESATNKRGKRRRHPLDTVSGKHRKQVAELQRRVAELEEEVAALRISIASTQSAAISVKKAKPGVKNRIEDETLFKYRDGLIRWLEAYWPWMEPRLRAAKTAVEVGAILEAASEEPYLRREWQNRLLPNPKALRDFLCSERFRKTLPLVTLKKSLHQDKDSFKGAANKLPTRQIANAMAGVPDITWRRSLDRCSVLPSPVTIPMNLQLYYREMCGLPLPSIQQLHLATSPVPKPIQPVAERADG